MVTVGIAGCGSITRFRHAPEYASNVNAKIVGFYNPTIERAEEMVKLYGGKVYGSYEEMLEDSSINAISVCSSNASHASMTTKALEAGKHVLCEKPMATKIEDALLMIEAANQAGKYLMVGHNQRFATAHVKAKEILASGELGKVLTFRTTFSHKGPEHWCADKSMSSWFFKKDEAFVGALGDLGTHKIDLIRWLTGDEITEVNAYMATLDKRDNEGNFVEVEDNVVSIMKTKSGIIGTLTFSWTNYGEEDNSTILYCSNGVMKIYDNPEFALEVIKKNGEKVQYNIGEIQTNTRQTKSGVIDAFVESIEKGMKPEVPGEEALASMKVIDACIESSQTGKSVTIV
jgi:UDP-N-acetylglucosamine 3-dehydrogenase